MQFLHYTLMRQAVTLFMILVANSVVLLLVKSLLHKYTFVLR